MANEMVLQGRAPNVIPFRNRIARSPAACRDDEFDNEFDDEYEFDAHSQADFSQPFKFGNLWHSMATTAKIMLSGRSIKPGEAYFLHLAEDGDMFLTQITDHGAAPSPLGAKCATWITCNCSIERIATRLKEAAFQIA